ncbi:MAG: glycoside hydrolase family 3 C-terminal domain-containing protein [Faecalibacterium sp.]|jgi:beta-glucosidase|nr:glycoside hydrolase family 3 C-terminal domain-containing protein [Faecalibacterium sp.]
MKQLFSLPKKQNMPAAKAPVPAKTRRSAGRKLSIQKRGTAHRPVWKTALAAVLLAALLAADAAAYPFDGALRSYLCTSIQNDAAVLAAQLEKSAAVARQIEAEGTVLVQNRHNTLPLAESETKVNVFGWASTQWLAGGSGSGRVTETKTDFLQALTAAGISYNSALTDMYRDFCGARAYASNAVGTLNSYPEQSCRLYEPAITDAACYSTELLAQAKAYSDTAIVVIGRFAGESNDCPKTQYKQVEKSGPIVTDTARTYLDLSAEEEALLAYVGQNYQNVIVLVNAPNTMALGAVETTPGVDACLLVGCTGEAAAAVLPDILYGKISPSGRTADTYAYDFSTAASYANAGAEGLGTYTQAEGLYPADGKTKNANVGDAPLYAGVSYLDYAEGIYTGYAWYETADAEGYWDAVQNVHGIGYAGVVQYPFGYGLSYTTFSWEIEQLSTADGKPLAADSTISAAVRVTNTGSAAGQDVVQLYDTPPYTPGGIEKAAVRLAAFAKTKVLQPGESETLTLSFAARDMASYDDADRNQNGFCGYELDAGDYIVSLRHDAHTPEPAARASVTLTLAENVQYPADAVTGAPVGNRFTGASAADGTALDGSTSGENIRYLSRADFVSTFPVHTAQRAISTEAVAQNLYTAEQAAAWETEHAADVQSPADGAKSETADAAALRLEENGTLTQLGAALGADYDDPRWEAVLAQIPQKELEALVLHGYTGTQAVASLGKAQTRAVDGPAQIGGFNQTPGTGFPNATTLAQTWNTALAGQFGRTVGTEAGQLGYSGWYAPGLNLHRSPFGGRNYEYYSEDALLAGAMGAAVISGSLDTGVACYAKHFAVCDQETQRDGLYCWMPEQALREVYLKPFQMAIEQGGCTGLMTAYGRLGAVWAGGSKALLTDVARGEWGFQGTILTDYSDHTIYMNADQALRAGGDLWMDGCLNNGTFLYSTDTPAFRQVLRRAAKDILYTDLNARAHNARACAADAALAVKPAVTTRFAVWAPALAILTLLAAAWFALCVYRTALWHRERKADGASPADATPGSGPCAEKTQNAEDTANRPGGRKGDCL